MGTFTISVGEKGKKEVLANLQHMTMALASDIKEAVVSSSETVSHDAKGFCPVSDGRLRSSIRAAYYRNHLASEVGTDVEYAPYVEFGSRPHWAPIAPLRRWAEKHGISPFAVQLSIARKGTPAQPFLFPAFEVEREYFIEKVKAALIKNLKRGMK